MDMVKAITQTMALILVVLLCCLVVGGMAVEYAVYQDLGGLPTVVYSQLAQMRVDTNNQLTNVNMTVARNLGELQQTVSKTTGVAAGLVDRHLTRSEDLLNGQLYNMNTNLDQRMREVTTAVTQEQSDISELIANVDAQIDKTTPFVIGTIAAAKVTAGETAQAAKDVQNALPQILMRIDDIGGHVDMATEQYSIVAKDTATFIERTTPPKIPTWLKWTIAIAPPLAQTTGGVIVSCVSLGACR